MDSEMNSNSLARLVCSVIIVVVIIIIGGGVPETDGLLTTCPGDVRHGTVQCLSLYDLQLDNLRVEGHAKFMTGPDVEIIRSICSSLSSSFDCVRGLRDSCPPESRDIIEEIVSPQATVVKMCRFPELFEVYAMNQRCYRVYSRESRQCYEGFLRQTKQPSTDEDFKTRGGGGGGGGGGQAYADHFCSNFRKLTSCICTVVEKCNPRLTNVTNVLVEASVPQSRFCRDHHHHHHDNNNHHGNHDNGQHDNQQQKQQRHHQNRQHHLRAQERNSDASSSHAELFSSLLLTGTLVMSRLISSRLSER